MDRILRSTQSTIYITFIDADGDPVEPSPATATYSVADSAGAVLVSGAATNEADGVGVYSATLAPAKTGTLDAYTVTWTATIAGALQTFTTSFEIVGGFLFGLNELRAFDSALADEGTYPVEALRAAREAAEERIELLCNRSFRKRGRRYTTDGTGSYDLHVPEFDVTTFVAGAVDGTNLITSEINDVKVYSWGLLRRTLGSWGSDDLGAQVLYEYGVNEAPEPVRRAAMALARENLVGTVTFNRATSESSDVGVLRFSLAGRDGPTGNPEVDAVVAQFGLTKLVQ